VLCGLRRKGRFASTQSNVSLIESLKLLEERESVLVGPVTLGTTFTSEEALMTFRYDKARCLWTAPCKSTMVLDSRDFSFCVELAGGL
jgi:hypothetical protein